MTDIPSTPGFIGLDVETTGLDPHTDLILELGIVLFDVQLTPIAHRSWITAGPRFLEHLGREMDPVAVEMHTANGLLSEIAAGGGSTLRLLREAEREAMTFLEEHGAIGWPMLGSSVTFDRAVLARRMPDLLAAIHYRSLDASSVLLALEAVQYPGDWPAIQDSVLELTSTRVQRFRNQLGITKPVTAHRAVDDILRSAALAESAMLVDPAEVFGDD